jgi:hypothetical protein
VQRIEGCGTGRELFAIPREFETRIDAVAPDVGEIVDVQAGEITRLLGGA